MRFSLIVATIGRTTELKSLLESLGRQRYRNFEVIVVDQNTDGRLLPVLRSFESRIEIRRIESAPGLSRARNVGLRAVSGEVVCFPDDDCTYPDGLLGHVNELLSTNSEWDGVVGDSVDNSGKPTLPWRDREGRLTFPVSWRRAISYAIFMRTCVIRRIGGFDETLGVGAGSPWGSGEDNDLVLRALKAGCYFQYDPNTRVCHPTLFPALDAAVQAKRYSYALGDGKLLQKHRMPLWWKLLFFSVPLARAGLAAARLKGREVRFHWLTVKGRMNGFFSSEHEGAVPFPLASEATPARARAASTAK